MKIISVRQNPEYKEIAIKYLSNRSIKMAYNKGMAIAGGKSKIHVCAVQLSY